MNYLFVTRFYTGMVSSMSTGVYAPSGVPAYHKLLDRLSSEGVGVTALLLAKTPAESEFFQRITERTFPELPGVRFILVPFYKGFLHHGSFAERVNEAVQMAVFAKWLVRVRPDLVYADRACLKAAAVASLAGFRTVARFLGIANFGALARSARARFLSPMVWLSLSARFDLILCTEDGSPCLAFFEGLQHRRSPVIIALNGVDISEARTCIIPRLFHDVGADLPVVLFVGRPTPDKGALNLLDALAVLHRRDVGFRSVFVCGTNGAGLREAVLNRGLSGQVTVLDSVPHNELPAYYGMADVYVSLNRFGNLSNTVLEALRLGVCSVILGVDQRDGTDASTERLLPSNAVVRVDRDRLAEELPETLETLLTKPKLRADYAREGARLAECLLWTWEERLKAEAGILRLAAKGGKVTREAAAIFTAKGASYLPPAGA